MLRFIELLVMYLCYMRGANVEFSPMYFAYNYFDKNDFKVITKFPLCGLWCSSRLKICIFFEIQGVWSVQDPDKGKITSQIPNTKPLNTNTKYF